MSEGYPSFYLRMLLPDGDPDGLKVIEKSNWIGCGLAFSRSLFKKYRNRPELTKPGVYLLFTRDESGNQLYIGEGDPTLDRLENHFRDEKKDWWEHVIVFTASPLNKAVIQFLEARLIQQTKEFGDFKLENGNIPKEPSLPEMDRALCEGFLREMLLCLPVLGIDLSTPKRSRPEEDECLLFLKGKGIQAEGYESLKGFVVKKGSQAVGIDQETQTIPPGVRSKRKILVDDGTVIVENKFLRFNKDFTFGSPSTAAAFVFGQSANGRDLWKDKNNYSLKILQLRDIDEKK